MKIQDCLLVIGELTMEKRYLEDQLEQSQAELEQLKTQAALVEAKENELREGGNG